MGSPLMLQPGHRASLETGWATTETGGGTPGKAAEASPLCGARSASHAPGTPPPNSQKRCWENSSGNAPLILSPHDVVRLPASSVLSSPVRQHRGALVPTAFCALACTNLHHEVTASRGLGTLVYRRECEAKGARSRAGGNSASRPGGGPVPRTVPLVSPGNTPRSAKGGQVEGVDGG